VKVFQIEEPDGSPIDPDAPGIAIGIDVSSPQAEVAVAVGGNAVMLSDRDGFELDLAVPSSKSAILEWQSLLEGARLRAERTLARPVTHAVVVAHDDVAGRVQGAATESRLILLRIVRPEALAGENRVLAAAVLAEDLAPRAAAPE
jgi:hypothetical protein